MVFFVNIITVIVIVAIAWWFCVISPQARFDSQNVDIQNSRYLLLLNIFCTLLAFADYSLELVQFPYNSVLYFFLATIVMTIGAHEFYARVWHALLDNRIHHDLWYLLGATVLYGYAFVALATGTLLNAKTAFFSLCTPMVLIVCILIRNFFERRVHAKANGFLQELRSYLAILPKDFPEDDSILINRGDIIPYDGVIVRGGSFIDEYIVTRERVPLWKTVGRKVFAGTTNKSDSFAMRVTAVGNNTILGHSVERMVAVYEQRKTFQVNSTKSSYVPPAALISALLIFVAWFNYGPNASFADALWVMISVFIALDILFFPGHFEWPLLTAYQQMTRHGIVVPDIKTIERADALTTVVLDQALFVVFPDGALYCNQVIFSSTVVDSDGQAFILSAFVSLAACFDNHITRAIINRFGSVSTHDVSSFENNDNYLKGMVQGHSVMLIPSDALVAHNIKCNPLLERTCQALSKKRTFLLYCVVDGVVVALLQLVQLLIPATSVIVRQLQALNIEVYMDDSLDMSDALLRTYQACSALEEKKAQIALVTDAYGAVSFKSTSMCIIMQDLETINTPTDHVIFLRRDSMLLAIFLNTARHAMNTVRRNICIALCFSGALLFQIGALSWKGYSLMMFPLVISIVMVSLVYTVIFSNSAHSAS